MMKKGQIRIVILLLAGALSGIFLLLSPTFLSPRSAKKGGIAVVEGWLIPELIEIAAPHLKSGDYKKIVVTGGPSDIRPFGMYLNGTVSVFPQTGIRTEAPLYFQTWSTPCKGAYAHFEVWLGEDLLLDTVSSGYSEEWEVSLPNGLREGTPLEFRFLNDEGTESEDRNFWVDSVRVNNQPWHRWAKRAAYSYYYEGKDQLEIRFPNNALRGANLLAYHGIDPEKIFICPTLNESPGGRTAAEAEAFAAWDRTCNTESGPYELISSNYHARRSFRLFKRTLGKKANWGIWSIGETTPSWKDWLDHTRRGEVMRQLVKWGLIGLFYHPELSTSQAKEPTSCTAIVPDEGVTPFGLTGFP